VQLFGVTRDPITGYLLLNACELIHIFISKEKTAIIKLKTVKPVCVGHLWFHSKPPHTGDKPLKIKVCTNTRAEVSFRVQRDVVKSEMRYITLLMINPLNPELNPIC
jgi:hypothetical protein